MPLFTGAQGVAKIYRGALPIARAYRGTKLVFDRSTDSTVTTSVETAATTESTATVQSAPQ